MCFKDAQRCITSTWVSQGFFVVGLSLSFSPPDCVSLPSMMTWAPCPHGVRTRGKKDLGQSRCSPTNPNRNLPDCCFLEADIVALFLPSDFNRIGTAACVSCQQMQTVDLSQKCVIELLGSTFACCSQVEQLSLPQNLRIIEQEAFLKRTLLQEVCIPPIQRVARSFEQFVKREKQNMARYMCTWRGACARLGDSCPAKSVERQKQTKRAC